MAEHAPDVLCLQEIKCREGEFPVAAFVEAGLPHLRISGQKGWHGVAIASRLPIEDAAALDVCREKHARAVSAIVAGVEIHNFYIPAGGDVADRALNPKFDHKLDFYERLTVENGQARSVPTAGDLRRPQTSRPASTTCGITNTCRRSSATRPSRSRRWPS